MRRRDFIIDVTGWGLITLVDNFKLMENAIPFSGSFVIEQFEDKGLAHFSYAVPTIGDSRGKFRKFVVPTGIEPVSKV